MKTRNSETLASFVAYCEAHPLERFWQVLRKEPEPTASACMGIPSLEWSRNRPEPLRGYNSRRPPDGPTPHRCALLLLRSPLSPLRSSPNV
jgi:hypothetical protein